jgi:hypothetical protein
MLSISQAQFDRIEADYREQRRARLLAQFRRDRPELAADHPDQYLLERIELVISEGKILAIKQNEDILDCVAISMLLARQAANNELIALVTRTLNKREWSARKRIQFIFAHIL